MSRNFSFPPDEPVGAGRVLNMVAVTADDLGMMFRNGEKTVAVLQHLNLHIGSGEIVAIRGANGTGKTTLLNLIAGLLAPTHGRVSIDAPAEGRALIGFVQQDYTSSLLPWFDVAENVAIPLRLQGMGRADRCSKAVEFLAELGFTSLPPHSYPHQLSGGQRQRVAIARALINRPAMLLMDEPFANLDAPSVRFLQQLLLQVQAQQGITIVFVSHDLDSSIYLSDRVVLLRGRPARVHCEFQVALPRPRLRELLTSNEFATTRATIVGEEEALQ